MVATATRAPRANVHIEPDRQFCYWGQTPDPHGGTGQHVSFEMHAVATNLTKGHDLRLGGVEVRGFRGEEVWHAIHSVEPALGIVVGADLRPSVAVEVQFVVTIERPEPLPSGPIRVRMRVKDQFGNRYRTKRITFKDSAQVAAKYQSPPGLP